jgi:hypothetical protein
MNEFVKNRYSRNQYAIRELGCGSFGRVLKVQTDNGETIALKLGLPETATEAEILAKVGTLQLAAQDAEKLQKEVEKQREQAVESEVDAAVKLKKITAEKRAHFVTLGKTAGIETLRATLECITPAVKPNDLIAPGATLASTGDYKKLSDVPDDKRIELRRDDPDTYNRLYKAEYGIEPKL